VLDAALEGFPRERSTGVLNIRIGLATDSHVRAGREMAREIRVGGKSAIVTAVHSDSIFQGQSEADHRVTAPDPNGILYFMFAAPAREAQNVGRFSPR
jgi:hypothetical protein